MKNNLSIAGFLFILIGGIIAGCYMIYDTYNFIEKSSNDIKSNIGINIILNKDTLTVIDHSYLISTLFDKIYVEINSLLIDSLKIK